MVTALLRTPLAGAFGDVDRDHDHDHDHDHDRDRDRDHDHDRDRDHDHDRDRVEAKLVVTAAPPLRRRLPLHRRHLRLPSRWRR
jgi:ABC-type Zn2+ transport system substrate-binding protein/surface adhesin